MTMIYPPRLGRRTVKPEERSGSSHLPRHGPCMPVPPQKPVPADAKQPGGLLPPASATPAARREARRIREACRAPTGTAAHAGSPIQQADTSAAPAGGHAGQRPDPLANRRYHPAQPGAAPGNAQEKKSRPNSQAKPIVDCHPDDGTDPPHTPRRVRAQMPIPKPFREPLVHSPVQHWSKRPLEPHKSPATGLSGTLRLRRVLETPPESPSLVPRTATRVAVI